MSTGNTKKRLCFRTLYNRYCTQTRDLATWMLGDPLEGEQIASKALMGLTLVKDQPTDEKQIREWIAMEVLSLCLEHHELWACAAEEDGATSDDGAAEDRDDEDEGEEVDLASDDLDDSAA